MFAYTANMPLIAMDPLGLQLLAPRIVPLPRVYPRIHVPPSTPPKPFIPFPPVPAPVPVPMPHGGPNPGNPPDPHPVHDPDAVDLPPPGRCTQARYDELFDAVGAACKGKKRPQACGFFGWSCDDYSDHEKLWRDCGKARRNMMNECFGGGNPRHRDEAKAAEENAKECEGKFLYWCVDPCPPSDPLIAMN